MTSSIDEVIGRAVRRIRVERGITQDELARAMRVFGVKSSPARVRELEAGKTRLTLGTVAVALAALRKLAGERYGLRDLLQHEDVLITSQWGMRGQYLADFLEGGVDLGVVPISPVGRRDGSDAPDHIDIMFPVTGSARPASLAEERAARRLDADIGELRTLALQLWGRPLDEEAAARGGQSAQSRGHATRQLQDELREQLDEWRRRVEEQVDKDSELDPW